MIMCRTPLAPMPLAIDTTDEKQIAFPPKTSFLKTGCAQLYSYIHFLSLSLLSPSLSPSLPLSPSLSPCEYTHTHGKASPQSSMNATRSQGAALPRRNFDQKRRIKLLRYVLISLAVALLFFGGLFLHFNNDLEFHYTYKHWKGEKPYEWYSRQAMFDRLSARSSSPLPRFNTSLCLFPAKDPFANIPALPQHLAYTPLSHYLTVYIIRYQVQPIFDWFWFTILQARELHPDAAIRTVVVKSVEEVRMHAEKQAGASQNHFRGNSNQPSSLVGSAAAAAAAQPHTPSTIHPIHVFVVTENTQTAATFLTEANLDDDHMKVGLILTGEENCANVEPISDRYLFVFMIYGNCMFLDGTRARRWPMGPGKNIQASIAAGRNSIHDGRVKNIKPFASRSVDINLVGSIRDIKITRAQAIFAYEEVCKNSPDLHLKCLGDWGKTIYAALGSVDNFFQSHLASLYSAYVDDYASILQDSKITLSPAGSNPECFRTMEAVMMGSIPVIEDWEEEGWSPLAFENYYCLKEDNNYFFRNAPVYWVKDWKRDLPPIVRYLTSNPEAARKLQQDMLQWYDDLIRRLRVLWLSQAYYYFHKK